MKPIFYLLLMAFAAKASAWDTSAKADFQRAYTNNVNLTPENTISDSYSTFGAYAQMKNDEFKFKLRGRLEKYRQQTENDNYALELSGLYKYSKTNDYTLAFFKQVYNGTPLVSTDTTSDNNGLRLSTTFSHSFNKDTTGYTTLTGTYKKYTKIDDRNDKILGVILGLEHYVTSDFLINPEFNIQNNSSADSYYSNLSVGPSLLLSFLPNEDWEIFVSGSYAYTSYKDRYVTTVVRRKTYTDKEYQKLTSLDFGTEYSFNPHFSLLGKFSTGKNVSNNSSQEYSAHTVSLGLSLKI